MKSLRILLLGISLCPIGSGSRWFLAHAHHPVPSQSGALQQLSWFSQSYQQPRSRILLSQSHQALRSGLNHGHHLSTNLLGQAVLRPWLFIDLQSQILTLLSPRSSLHAQTGWGNSRLALSGVWSPETQHSKKSTNRWKIINTLSLSVPTRTVTYVVDPGPTWIGSASILGQYGGQYGRGRLDFQLFHQVSFETRPSGLALDLGFAASIGRSFGSRTRLGLGSMLDLRTGNWCRKPNDRMQWCSMGRSTEVERKIGAARLYTLVSFDAQIASSFSMGVAFFSPVTKFRDFDIRSELRLQLSFG